ncbi:MAG: type II toxin-antitoxin system prevent-host-death family antitoxin [Treponema sp.]|nr:type II toxin-antitoxin system prevent-host-death family antitoxin [Treponema sp.]
MAITTMELQLNLTKYLALAETEQIFITENGRTIAVLSSPNQDRIETATSLFGILPDDMTLEESKSERLSRI